MSVRLGSRVVGQESVTIGLAHTTVLVNPVQCGMAPIAKVEFNFVYHVLVEAPNLLLIHA